MINLQSNLDRFNRELTLLQGAMTSWHEELQSRETQVTNQQVDIKRQRDDLISKSNLIIEQVNGLRKQKDDISQKTLEAEKLKKSAVTQLEEAENKLAEASLKETELQEREKAVKSLEEQQKLFKKQLEDLEIEKATLLHAQTLLKTEQELSDDKQQALIIREKRLEVDEAKQKRIMSGI